MHSLTCAFAPLVAAGMFRPRARSYFNQRDRDLWFILTSPCNFDAREPVTRAKQSVPNLRYGLRDIESPGRTLKKPICYGDAHRSWSIPGGVASIPMSRREVTVALGAQPELWLSLGRNVTLWKLQHLPVLNPEFGLSRWVLELFGRLHSPTVTISWKSWKRYSKSGDAV
ncbi:hypothetical protein F5882DRAFT_409791 [Hyaloscypha sp. PMI_1271]|nr:hypothetical protein F5882DRAFT_409791 [Hyaloscypha sp. PMI_1271]